MKNNLNEEIEKFRKLSGVLNEATGPTSWVAEFLGMIKAGVKRVPDDLLKSDELKDLVKSGKVTLTAAKGIQSIDWAKLSVDEIMVLFKWDYILDTFKQLVTKNKIDVSETAIDTYKGSFKKIADAYRRSSLTLGQAFKAGYHAKGGASLFTKRALRFITADKLVKHFPTYFQKLTKEEVKKMHGWFWLGVGDYRLIVDIFKRHGFPHAVANLGGQYFKKWAFWSTMFSISNFMIGLTEDNDVIYESDLEWIKERSIDAFELAGLHWVLPVTVVWSQIISPVGKEGLRNIAGRKFKDGLEKLKTKAEKEKDALENMKSSVNDTTGTSTTQNSVTY